MTKQFEFESRTLPDAVNPDHFAMLEVEISIECRDHDGCDAMYTVEWLAVKGSDAPLKETDLSPEDQVYLDRAAQDIADEQGPEVYNEWMRGRADAEYDSWKDGSRD